jgi:L-threonylcarbamoyladenylate synthase
MLRVDPIDCSPDDLAPAVAWLRRARVVAFPTDTVYGLAVDPSSERALEALFALKGRASDAAVPLVAASRAQVDAWCGLGEISSMLAAAFWPGPLSLVCDAPAGVAPALHAGRGTIAIRVPDHRVARALAYAWGSPITATSANRSGEPPAVRAGELAALASAVLMVVDGGDTAGGPPSTIVDARGREPVLLREGAIAWSRVLHSLQR